MSAFVCLDFADADGRVQPRCLGHFARVIAAHTIDEVAPALAEVDAALAAGEEVVGWLAYEAAPAFDRAMRTHKPRPELPLLWFGVGGREIERPDVSGDYRFGPWQPAIDEAGYHAAFDRIQQRIRDGDTYQINYTFAMRSAFTGHIAALYERLSRAQMAAWCAWIHTDAWEIVSASPELFFQRRGEHLRTRPMKGTRPRGRTTEEDRALADDLRHAAKDRAENVMIVDLLRNDMGRLARLGSVRPSALFTVEKYPTVWQLTSTIEAQIPADTRLSRIFRELFPCGSITGAPKVKTMEIIAAEEREPRGVYCGSIGWAQGDRATFNVAIRTLTLRDGEARYHVGSGLVADSQAEAEYGECLDKALVLQRAAVPDFQLLETLAWQPHGGFVLLDRHLHRLADTADYFSIPLDTERVRRALREAVAGSEQGRRVRLLIDRHGVPSVQTADLPPPASRPQRVGRAPQPIDAADPFLYHKTTHRAVYDAARAARPDGIDELLLFNTQGEVTEATIANVAIEREGVWLTPPIRCGLLAGTQRAELLARGQWQEGVIRIDDLRPGQPLQLANSVRGLYAGEYEPG